MKRSLRRLAKKAGLPPGTLTPGGERQSGPVRITIIDYDPGRYTEKTVDRIEECFPFRDTPSVTWINIDGLSNPGIIETIGKYFTIHPLILESILTPEQRPRMEDLEQYLYLNLKMLSWRPLPAGIKIENISLVIGPNYLLSFQEDIGDIFDPIRDRIRKDGRIRKFGPDYLAYGLIDVIVDNYFVVVEQLSEQVEDLEEELVAQATRETLNRIHVLKKDMIFLRKSVWPLREVISKLERSESSLIQDTTKIYLRDVYDHTIQVIDTLEIFRDMLSGMIDIYLSSLSNRMNEIMKVLTLIATIFIPLTFIAGVYGMNFENMPELKWKYGYYVTWGIMISVACVLLLFFRKKKWI